MKLFLEPDILRGVKFAAFVLAALCACTALAAGASAATFTVDVATDSPALSACTAAPADCSLRGAIDAANGQANTGGQPDLIDFDALLTSVQVDSPLPPVSEALKIDGAGTAVVGSLAYQSACEPDLYAFVATSAALERTGLPINAVCARAVNGQPVAPTIQVGPRRADNSVPISGLAAAGQVEIYRADSPAVSGESAATFARGIASNGAFSYLPPTEPSAGERFAATVTAAGSTSNFSALVQTPSDLVSPTLMRAVAISNNALRLDFNEPISPSVISQPGAFGLSMGGIAREVTNVGVDVNTVVLTTLTTPWNTGDAGSLTFTGNGRVTDMTGNELLGQPVATVFSGPGEVTGPTISRLKLSNAGFCLRRTRACTKRLKIYVGFYVNKPTRVTFTIMRQSGRRFVVRYTHRYPAGQVKSGLSAVMRGRRLPATGLIVQVMAEDVARNLSPPAEIPFRVAKRNADLRTKPQRRKKRAPGRS